MAISFCARGRVWIDRFDSAVLDPRLLKGERGANPVFAGVDLIQTVLLSKDNAGEKCALSMRCRRDELSRRCNHVINMTTRPRRTFRKSDVGASEPV
jgi:hypothetical protein